MQPPGPARANPVKNLAECLNEFGSSIAPAAAVVRLAWVVGYLLFPADFSIISLSLIILRGSHLVLLAHVAPPADQDPDDAGVSVPGAGVQGRVPVLKCHDHEELSESDKLSHVVLQVGLAAVEEQHTAGLVVAVLTAEVERREPAPVLDVEICF